MRFINHDEKQGPTSLHIEECEVPSYNPEVERLIRVEATAVNRADLLQSMGKYPPPQGVTNIIGLECSGYLVDPQTNQVTGEKVMALVSGGAYAQYVKVHKDHLMQLPKNMDFATSAAIPEAWITAYQLLHKIAKIKEGETALILAAASGVGTCLIQLCKYAGASSIAVSSSYDKLQRCKE